MRRRGRDEALTARKTEGNGEREREREGRRERERGRKGRAKKTVRGGRRVSRTECEMGKEEGERNRTERERER